MKDRFYELQGELNQIQSTRSWLDSKGKLIVAELDALEKAMQEAHRLTDEQRAIRDSQGGCVECGDD